MKLIHGITVTLIEDVDTGLVDELGNAVYETTETDVENVIVSPSSSEDITDSLSLYGKKAEYTLGIPKGDTHSWTDCKVKFFGRTWQTIGFPLEGIDDLVPLDWNRKVRVEVYG